MDLWRIQADGAMLRKLVTTFTLLGLLLSVGLWQASHFGYFYGVILDDYELLVWAGDCRIRRNPPRPAWMSQSLADATKPPTLVEEHIKKLGSWGLPAGVSVGRMLRGPPTHSVPLWIPSVAFLVLRVSCVVPSACRRRKRKKLGLCLKCGYDLRGSKEQCPECGTGFST